MTTYVEKRLKRKFEEKYDFGWAGEHDDDMQHWTDDLL